MGYKIHMGGERVEFAKFPKKEQDEILARLGEKHPELITAMETGKTNIIIDGKERDYSNIKEIEVPNSAPELPKYTESDLKAMNKKDQIALISKLGYTEKAPRLESGRIKLILELQGE